MKRPWSKDDYQREFADEIIRQIERGVAPWQKPWRPGERGSPENFSTAKAYTGGEQHLPGRSRGEEGLRR